MSTPNEKRREVRTQEDWERVLSAAAHLQEFIPDAVLVGGSAAALHAEHRFSYDDDHVVANLKSRFEDVLSELERQAGWVTNRVQAPVMILGDLDGVETGIRQLIRSEPLETEVYRSRVGNITLPTRYEMTRIKAFLVVRRNATRDYLDLVALLHKIEQGDGPQGIARAFASFDILYPQQNGASVTLQLAKQLAEPHPKDLGDGSLDVYRIIDPGWLDWSSVTTSCRRYAALLLAQFRNFSP